ncbi:cytochrome-c oxidase [Planococcus shenhongbingii]|uniref:Cytochrome-c oxidase n=1 Tax=Planococcus shenhongbingii TaxID=3058398 RepID=A0ABT8NBX1_9BACL|nr:cytochrome-c oxidase [Planococcus sp. N017]MDN7245382.1 cytochrome-c oxidase [Planococcus sp. N017]
MLSQKIVNRGVTPRTTLIFVEATINTKGVWSKMGTAFIKVAAVYLLVGTSLGIYMGIVEKFEFTPVHAHINLVGWATMGIFGLIYSAFPRAGNSGLGKIHFWLHNIGALLLLVGMTLFATGEAGTAFPIAVTGALTVIAATLVFIVNLFRNVKAHEAFRRNE